MIRDRVLDDLEQLDTAACCLDAEVLQQLHCQIGFKQWCLWDSYFKELLFFYLVFISSKPFLVSQWSNKRGKNMKASLFILTFSARTHEATEAVVGARDAGLWVDLNEDVVAGANVNLQKACPVQGTVEQHQQTLQCQCF